MTDTPAPSALHWFPFYPDEWVASPAVSMMLPEQEGAYLRLLIASWGKGDAEPSLPNDPIQLAQVSRLGSRWKKLGALVLAQFEVRGDRRVNAKLAAIWWEQQQKHAVAVVKAKKAALARHGKNAAPSNAPSNPQADLGLAPSTQNLDGSASPPTPYGVEEEKHEPADDAGLAPAGAAPADVAATTGTGNSTGDYRRAHGARESLARAGYRPDPDDPPAPQTPLAEQAAAIREREDRYRSALEGAVTDWEDAHPEAAARVEAEQRERLGFRRPVLSLMQTQMLRQARVEAIRHREGWPALDAWDGTDILTHAPEVPC